MEPAPTEARPQVTALFLSPHPDDAVLFGCYTLLAERPDVVTVLWPDWQEKNGIGIPAQVRLAEDCDAMEVLGLSDQHEQWLYSESDPDWAGLARVLRYRRYDRVYAPLPETAGHRHHNEIGTRAAEAFGDRVRFYLTYTKAGRSEDGREVKPVELAHVTLKLRALACYRSQIETAEAGCTEHFVRGLREYLAR